MKKLLFTLATLLMAGGMFAGENYCFIEDFTITQDQLGTEIEVPIAIHADDAFSAYQADFVFPDGLTIVEFMEGADATVDYFTNTGRSRTATAQPGTNEALTRILAAFQAAGYVQAADGTWQTYGAISWMAGDYEEVAIAIFEVSEDFKGGEIEVVSKLSHASNDNTPALIGDVANGTAFTKICTVTVEGGQEEPKDFQGTVTLGVDEAGNVTATYTPADGETVPEDMEITVDPTKVNPGTTEVSYTVTAEGYNDKTGKQNVTYTPDATEPVITFTPGETGVTISVEPATSWEVIVDGENMGQINFVEKTWDEQHIVVNATNAPDNYNPATATDTYDLAAKEPADLTGDITIGAVDENGKVYVTYTGDEEVTLSATVDGEDVDIVDGYIQLPGYGEFEIEVTASATHYNDKTKKETRTWEEPAYQTPAPTVVPTVYDNEVTITATGEGTVILYVTTYDDATGASTTTQYTNPASVTIPRTDEAQYVTYWATAQRDADALVGTSDTEYYYEIPAKEVKIYDVIAPTVTGAQNDEAYVITVVNNDPYATVTLYVTTYDPETGAPVKTPYTTFPVIIPRTNEDQMISFYADATLDAAPEGYTDWNNASTPSQSATVEALAPTELEGVVVFGEVDQATGQVPVSYTGTEEGVTLTVTCEAKREVLPIEDGKVQLPGYGTWTLTGTASKGDLTTDPTIVDRTWEKPALEELEGDVIITVADDGTIVAQYAPADGEPTDGYTITTNPTKLDDYGTYTVTYTVEHEGYEPLEDSQEVTWTAPVSGKTDAPGSNQVPKYVQVGGVTYNSWEVTLTETEPSDIYYRIGTVDPETGAVTWSDWMLYEDVIVMKQPGTYMWEAYAIAPGKEKSDNISGQFTVSEATSIEELFAGKNVASVRHFNMAGQEMQEANGICISVYTFTDGTQVAVKVMK